MSPPRRGRPLGSISLAVLGVVRREPYQPTTITGLALQLQLSYSLAARTVSRLRDAGYVEYGAATAGRHDRPARLVLASAPAEALPRPDAFALRWRST